MPTLLNPLPSRGSVIPAFLLLVMIHAPGPLPLGMPGAARANSGQDPPKLIVATKHAPPFAFRDENGEWQGLSIDLWDEIATRIGIEYELREMPLDQMFEALEADRIDAAIAAISVTAEREQRFDFSQPYFHTGLGIAVRLNRNGGFWMVLGRILSGDFFKILLGLIVLVLVTSVLFYWLERNRNQKSFTGERKQGLGEGLWWSIVLLLGKVVYPQTLGARVLAVVAMVISALAISALTGAIASALTVQQIDTPVDQLGDLHGVRTAAVSGGTSTEALKRRRIGFRAYPSAEEALKAVAEREMDAAVYDAPMLRHLISERFDQYLDVLPIRFMPQNYAIALPTDSRWDEPINRALLTVCSSDDWQRLRFRYLGE